MDDRDRLDPQVRTSLNRAADATTPPAPGEPAEILAGGPRGLRRRRMVVACGALAAALVAGAATALSSPEDRAAAPPSQDQRGPRDQRGEGVDDTDREALDRLVGDPDAHLDWIIFDGPDRSAATLSQCDDDESWTCQNAVLLTTDGWDSHVAAPLPDGEPDNWLALASDGSVAVVNLDDAVAFRLHADASTTELTYSETSAAAGQGSVLVGSPRPNESDYYRVWVLDSLAATVHPFDTQPPGRHLFLFDKALSDSLVVPIERADKPHSIFLAVSTDNGQTWTTQDVPEPQRGTLRHGVYTEQEVRGTIRGTQAGVYTGRDGRVAVHYPGDDPTGDTTPFNELYVSDDYGASWHAVQAPDRPRMVGGMAWTSDGRLLVLDDERHQLWELSDDLTGLDQVAPPSLPATRNLSAVGGVLVMRGSAERSIAVSVDGVRWRDVTPGAPGPAVALDG